mmetsp:Transcript_27833/g.61045  ORF Transcript_27833/g.61045 Transcript_27833/m.61045 type:complete len:98 (-) Transcript_27833:1611-1904(-)
METSSTLKHTHANTHSSLIAGRGSHGTLHQVVRLQHSYINTKSTAQYVLPYDVHRPACGTQQYTTSDSFAVSAGTAGRDALQVLLAGNTVQGQHQQA